MSQKYANIKTEKKQGSETEVVGDVTVEAVADFRKKAVRNLGETANIAGFRKGHIPENILVEKLGEAMILEETAEIALKEIVPEIIEKEVPNYIGRPEITITKLAPGNPIGFKIVVASMPEVKLPDYKKIAEKAMAEKEDSVEVTDKEIDSVIEEIKKQHAHNEFHKANKDAKGHNHDDKEMEKFKPDFTDDFVKTLGAFANIEDFKTKAKENMSKEKEHKNKEKKRGAMLDKLISETKVEMPKILIEAELDKMFSQFEGDIQSMGIKIEDYLKHIKKTPEDLRKDWHTDAEKRAKLNLVLIEIAKAEKLAPNKEAVDFEVNKIKEAYKDVDPIRAQAYVEHSLTLEEAIKFLEGKK